MKTPDPYRFRRWLAPSWLSGAFLGVLLWLEPARGAPPGPEQKLNVLLADTARLWATNDFAAARTLWQQALTGPDTQPQFQSYAHWRIAQCYLAETNLAAAQTEFQAISDHAAYPLSDRLEADECQREVLRKLRGLPAQDALASRTRIAPTTHFAAEYFVSPQGRGSNPGTRAAPFATLEQARDAIRARKTQGVLPGPVCVNLLPGEYPVYRTFELTMADSGTAAAPVVYRAELPGTAVLYGGQRLTGWAPVTNAAILDRLPAAARGKVFQCDLKQAGITNYSPLTERGFGVKPPGSTLELFFNGNPLTLARWPNSGFVNGGKIVAPGSVADQQPSVFVYLEDRPARWTNAPDAWLFGYFNSGWADRTLPIRGIDPARKQITCAPYDLLGGKMGAVSWFNHGRIKYYAFNLLEEMDVPGEWYLDRSSGVLYLYPPSEPAGAVVEIGRLDTLMVCLSHVSHVRLEGLGFDLSRTDGLTLEACEDCLVAGCTVKRFAGSGIFIRGGRADGVLGCDLYRLGRGGVEVTGGDRLTLTPARHFVENCLMYSLGRLDRTYVPGISMSGVGIRAAHNRFFDCPSSAIRFDGNELLMEYNQMDHVVLESEDQGAMETWGNPTFQGNVLRYNLMADIGPQPRPEGNLMRAGIRLDDVISGTVVYGNIFYHAAQSFGGVNINGGRDNIIENNIFAECEKGITGNYDPQNVRWKLVGQQPDFLISARYLERYPGLRQLAKPPGLNHAWRNIFWKCGPLFTTYGQPAADKFDRLANAEYATGDPGFVNAAQGDFRLKPDAEVIGRIGFHPIPVTEIGLYQDEYRASWPEPSEETRGTNTAERSGTARN